MWKIIIKDNVENYMSRNRIIYKRFKKIINNKLKINPIPSNKKHIIDRKNNKYLCEFGIDKIRFLYIIEFEKVIIFGVEYEGNVKIFDVKYNYKSGNKNYPNQQRDLKKVKKDFKDGII